MRGLILATWALDIVIRLVLLWAVIQLNIKLDRDRDEHGILMPLLKGWSVDVTERVKPPPPSKDEWTGMGMDFGVGQIVSRMLRRAGW